jgi:hypothetical protein
MITVEALKTLLESGLNELANEMDAGFNFVFFANMGDYRAAVQMGRKLPKPIVDGILSSLQSTVVPVKSLNNFYIQLKLDILVPERLIGAAQSVLNAYIEANAGGAGIIGEFAYIFNMNIPDVGTADIFPNVGEAVPISTTVFYQFIKDGVLSNNCHFSLDNEDVLFLDASISRSRINQTDNVENSEEMASLIPQQGLQFNATIPFLNKGNIKALVEEVNSGALGGTHSLEYSDGVTTSRSWTVTLKDGSISYQAGKVPTITASFLIARA